MKFTLNILEKRTGEQEKHWPGYVFGGRLRTSTLVLILAFLGVWWVYNTYSPDKSGPANAPATQYVPLQPGMKPDPDYTWVPKSRLQQPPQEPEYTWTPTPTTTETTVAPTTTIPTTTTTTTTPPPFTLPTLPCLPPFCTPTPTPSAPSQQTHPGTAPVPTSTAPGH